MPPEDAGIKLQIQEESEIKVWQQNERFQRKYFRLVCTVAVSCATELLQMYNYVPLSWFLNAPACTGRWARLNSCILEHVQTYKTAALYTNKASNIKINLVMKSSKNNYIATTIFINIDKSVHELQNKAKLGMKSEPANTVIIASEHAQVHMFKIVWLPSAKFFTIRICKVNKPCTFVK